MAESTETAVWSDMVGAASAETIDRIGLAAVPFAGGIAIVARSLPTVLHNRAFGFGLDRPVTEEELDATIALYRRDAPFSIQPSPAARPDALGTWLEARGLQAFFHWVRWVRDTASVPEVSCDLAIERIAADEADTFGTLACTIFRDDPSVQPWIARTVGRPRWSHYVARDQGRPVAIGMLRVNGEMAWIGGGATLESHRGRGAQSALIARRVADAQAQGCRWITTETADDLPERPSASFRNMRRTGFTLLYRRPSHAYFPPEPAPPRR